MASAVMALPHPLSEIGGNECIDKEALEEGELEGDEPECFKEKPLGEGETNNYESEIIKKEDLEEGEIEDDESAGECLHASRSLLPANNSSKASKRKRNRKAKLFKKRKLNHTLSLQGTMEVSHDDGTLQTDDHELFVQSKYSITCSNVTPSRNCDECLAYSDSSSHYNDPCNDKKDPETYNICKTFCFGTKKPIQKSLNCKQKKLIRKTMALKNRHHQNGPSHPKLGKTSGKSCTRNKNNKCLYMNQQSPCNFDHTGVRCITEDLCKFKHEEFRKTLNSLHEQQKSATKKFTSNIPQLSRSKEAAVNCHNKSAKKIPSLLEIVVPVPAQFQANKRNFTVSNEQSISSTCHMTSRDETRPCTPMQSSLNKTNHARVQQIVNGKKGKLSDEKKQPVIFNRQKDVGGSSHDCVSAVSSFPSDPSTEKNQTETEHHRANMTPPNLPKKQQELFQRIQQKQRQPLHLKNQGLGGKDKTGNEEAAEQTVDEQNRYSSDEDDSSLLEVLKKLPRLQSFPSTTSISSISTFISDMSSSASVSKSSDQLLCNVRDQPRNNGASLTARYILSAQTPETFHTTMQTLASQNKENVETPVLMNSSSKKTVTSYSNLGNTSNYKAVIESCPGGGTRFSKNDSGVVNLGNVCSVRQNENLQTKIKRDVHSIHLASYFSTVSDKICRDSVPSKDVDFRKILEMLFSPPSLHKPTLEINASLNSHARIPYKLIPITIQESDCFGLRACNSRDPRLQRTSGIYKGADMHRFWQQKHSL